MDGAVVVENADVHGDGYVAVVSGKGLGETSG